jgi:hypothetical protein
MTRTNKVNVSGSSRRKIMFIFQRPIDNRFCDKLSLWVSVIRYLSRINNIVDGTSIRLKIARECTMIDNETLIGIIFLRITLQPLKHAHRKLRNEKPTKNCSTTIRLAT